MANAIVIIH